MKALIYASLICMLFVPSCLGQSKQNQEMIIKDFAISLTNDSVSSDEIIEKFLVTKNRDKTKLDFIKTHLQYAREELKKNNFKADKFIIIRYSYVREEERKITISNDQIKDVYLVYYTDEESIPILFENNKIKAFATLDKSGKKFFMEY